MADAALNPDFLQEEFDKEKEKLIEGLKTDENSVPAAARRVESLITYGKNHPSGEFIREETVNNVQLEDVKRFYTNNFTPQNAYLVIIGDVDFKTVKKQVTKLFKKLGGRRCQGRKLPCGKKCFKS